MSYAIGSKAIRKLCAEQNPMAWQRAKLSPALFKPYEIPLFEWVRDHLKAHHVLPQLETLQANFPDVVQLETLEPSGYYIKLLENQFFYESINKANVESQSILKQNQDDHEKALEVLRQCTRDITEQRYRLRILDVATEAPSMVLLAYHNALVNENAAEFGWPYLDNQSGGAVPGEVISFVGRPAVGKAQPLDAKVLTLNGFERMGDIQIGDKLASVDGEESVVTGIFPQGKKSVYRLEFQDGRSTEASDEHLWEVMYRDWTAPKVWTTLQLIAKLKFKRYQKRLSIRLFSGVFGKELKAPFSPYLLGVLIGDGCFVARDYIRLTTADFSIARRVRAELRMAGLDLKKTGKYEYSIHDERSPRQNRMRQWITDLGMRFHRSEEKFIPTEYLSADRETRSELLRGLLDTDGTAGKNGAVVFSSSSLLLAGQVVDLVRGLGGKASLKTKKTKCLLHYTVTIVCQRRTELFTLERKRERVAKERTTHTNHRLVLGSIEYVGEKDCQCITVSHTSHLYVTDEFIVTHNSWMMLWAALHNWVEKKMNVLFVSMEMMTLPIAQRIAALYTHQNIQQLKVSGYSDKTLKKFHSGLKVMELEKAKFYVIDGNLAANAEDIFVLADMLECKIVFIDGAYLLRHRNVRLDRFMRAAENVELIKRYCTDLDMTAFCSWQFNRVASQKQKKGGGEQGDLEDIGYTDAIGQISSIALSLFQEDSVETMKERKIRVMKGRNGEVGQFSIAWSFGDMSFHQTDPPIDNKKHDVEDLQWV